MLSHSVATLQCVGGKQGSGAGWIVDVIWLGASALGRKRMDAAVRHLASVAMERADAGHHCRRARRVRKKNGTTQTTEESPVANSTPFAALAVMNVTMMF